MRIVTKSKKLTLIKTGKTNLYGSYTLISTNITTLVEQLNKQTWLHEA